MEYRVKHVAPIAESPAAVIRSSRPGSVVSGPRGIHVRGTAQGASAMASTTAFQPVAMFWRA